MERTVPGDNAEANGLEMLTPKQREVLDLLIEHKTSKEISRLLGISPYTVDQRINLARAKLNLANRGEVAHVYRRLVEISRRSVYEPSYVASPPVSDAPREQEDTVAAPAEPVLQLAASGPALAPAFAEAAGGAASGTADQAYYRVLPEMFDGPHGTVLRLGFMVGIALFLMLVALGAMAMFSQLGVLMDR